VQNSFLVNLVQKYGRSATNCKSYSKKLLPPFIEHCVCVYVNSQRALKYAAAAHLFHAVLSTICRCVNRWCWCV